MEEIVLIFSSLAGAFSAVAIDKVPKIKRKQPVTITSAMQDQLQSLKMEKEILSKTITRLHQKDSSVSKIQKDKLLVSYQHQLGTVMTRIEKLEVASKYPDLGPMGDSLISLMDNRLSQLDHKLHELTLKITANTNTPVQPKQMENYHESIQERPSQKKVEEITTNPSNEKIEIQYERVEIPKERTVKLPSSFEIPPSEKHRMVELSTLTEITNKIPEFPAELIRSTSIAQSPIIPEVEPKAVVNEPITIPESIVENSKIENVEVQKPELVVQEDEKIIQLPTPIKIPEEEKLEDDDKDLDKIKSEIMKALSKLEQVEVE